MSGTIISRASQTVSFPSAQSVDIASTNDSVAIGSSSGTLANVSAKNGLVTEGNTLACRIDAVSSSTTYVGKASIGTATSAASWQVQKIAVSGTETAITWADGNNSYDNIWDNRASLSYS